MKLRLIIKKEDGSLYWRDHFNSYEALNEWLETEKTRPYWVQSYTTEVEDLTPVIDPSTVARDKERFDALSYLALTDWYLIRKIERAIDVPEEVKQLRLAAINKMQ
jgi:hypothetical protein